MRLYDAIPTLTVWPYAAAAIAVLVAGVAGLLWLRREKRGQR